MKKGALVAGLLFGFISAPIGFYLQYKVLKGVEATELMMFLFWVNLPLIVFIRIIGFILQDWKKEDLKK